MTEIRLMANGSHGAYVRSLESHVTRYLSVLESIFGPRDPGFLFNSVGCSDDGPCTHFPDGFHFGGKCRVDILISRWPWENCCADQGPWQIAHECVHLLDPGTLGSASVLEEGLATWFQNEPRYHDEPVRSYIAGIESRIEAYANAEALVRSRLPGIIRAVKALRASGTRIREIKEDLLAPLVPEADTDTLERLCARFQN